jgi:hypothetical protein
MKTTTRDPPLLLDHAFHSLSTGKAEALLSTYVDVSRSNVLVLSLRLQSW